MPQFMQNQEFLERFKVEAIAMGKLQHPNIVNITDFGFASFDLNKDKTAYLVMEFLNGYDLGTFLKSRGKLSLDLVVDIVEQISLALYEAHKQGIIHRDLKPDNIWLEPDGRGDYKVKILDFGLAKLKDNITTSPISQLLENGLNFYDDLVSKQKTLEIATDHVLAEPLPEKVTTKILDDNNQRIQTLISNNRITDGNIDPKTIPGWMTRVGTILGTPLYMSPEQCSGAELSIHSDIYSLGVITYQMLTGETPFAGNIHDLIHKHISETPPNIEKKLSGISKSIATLIMKSLSKRPIDRPNSVIAFAKALRINAEGEKSIMNQALTTYSKHFSTFLQFSVPIYLSFAFLAFFPLLYLSTLKLSATQLPFANLIQKGGWLFASLVIFFANSLYLVVSTSIIERLRHSSKNTVQFREIATLFKKNFFTFLKIKLQVALTTISGFFKKTNGAKLYLDYSLSVPIAINEKIKSQEALERSKTLVTQLGSISFYLQLQNFLAAIIVPFAFSLIFLLNGFLFDIAYDFLIQNKIYLLKDTIATLPTLISVSTFFVLASLMFLLNPIFPIATSIFYFKACQITGNNNFEELFFDGVRETKRLVHRNSFDKQITLLASLTCVLVVFCFFAKENILLWAVSNEKVNTLKAAIYLGTNINAKNSSGEKALVVAIKNNDKGISGISTNCLVTLLQAGADVNINDLQYFGTPLHLAASLRRPDVVHRLLMSGIDVDIRNDRGETPLMVAANNEDLFTVKKLLAVGADIKAKDNYGRTLLHHAVDPIRYNSAILDLLLSSGINPNIKDNAGKTPLMSAAEYGFTYSIKPFIDFGADVNIQDNKGNTALSLAAKRGHKDIVKTLTSVGAKTNSKEEAFICAAAVGNTFEIKELATLGLDINAEDSKPLDMPTTPLMYAASHGHKETVEELIKLGANVNFIGKNGKTALMCAAFYRNASIVEILLAKGADPNYTNNDKENVLTTVFSYNYATMSKSPLETLRVLLNSKINLNSDENAMALVSAAAMGQEKSVKLLLEAGINLKYSQTALKAAEQQGYRNIVKLFDSSTIK
jgi:hypothetical protein